MVHVPYKGGGPMVTDLLGGSVQVVIADQANLMPHVQSGKLRALAVATPKRSPNAPDLPTIAETGLAGFDATAWQGLVGPAGMPPDVVKRLNEAFNKVMAMPAVREKLVGGGLDAGRRDARAVRALHRAARSRSGRRSRRTSAPRRSDAPRSPPHIRHE